MYARTTVVLGDARAVDDGVAVVRQEVWPMMQALSGCVGLSMLADRERGRCIVTSAWATEEAMQASAESVRGIRQQVAEVLRADAVDLAEWEIALLHRARPAGDAACVRVIWTDAEAGAMEGIVDAFRMSLLPQVEDLPGFCSVSLLVDRPGNRAVTAVTYADRRAMEAARDQGVTLRREFTGAMGMTVTEVAEFDLVVAHLRVPEMA